MVNLISTNRYILDIEANGLEAPSKIWLIILKDIDKGSFYIFREVSDNEAEKQRAIELLSSANLVVGHNILGYDCPVINDLLGYQIPTERCVDTLIISRLVNYSRDKGHSVEAYGEEFGQAKLKNSYPDFFKQWSQGLEDYCIRDVNISEQIYHLYAKVIHDPAWKAAIDLEQQFQLVVNALHKNGFAFNATKAKDLLSQVTEDLGELDAKIETAFPPRTKCIREYSPRCTKFGTIARNSVPRGTTDLSAYSEGATFCTFQWEDFNPSSHKQIIEVLYSAGWVPTEKTKTHIEAERTQQSTETLRKYGWKINETNLGTLPAKAPEPARLLAKRILLESRRRTLSEWLSLVQDDGRIHGRFYGIGAWTHRMAHQQPNTANIPNELDTSGKRKLLGKEMRQLWMAPKKRLLVGVDAEGIQLRIFAHYIDDKEFTDALVRGQKSAKTDPHSLNQRILGPVCKSRAAAKRFVYALLLGAGIGKLGEILEVPQDEAKAALDRLMERYEGFRYLKKHIIPADGRRGWFVGLDGRHVQIPGETPSERSHLCMSGYLQNGEAVVMKRATLKWLTTLPANCKLVNFVHDEWQTETPNNVAIALEVAQMQADSLREVGEELGLKCPLAGSYWNDDHKDYTIGTNWYQTH